MKYKNILKIVMSLSLFQIFTHFSLRLLIFLIGGLRCFLLVLAILQGGESLFFLHVLGRAGVFVLLHHRQQHVIFVLDVGFFICHFALNQQIAEVPILDEPLEKLFEHVLYFLLVLSIGY